MSEDLIQRAISCVAASQKIPPEKITLDSTFEELGIDSLDGINVVFALENEFDINIPDERAQGMRTIRDMIDGLRAAIEGGKADTAQV